jgi:hypothetical protein
MTKKSTTDGDREKQVSETMYHRILTGTCDVTTWRRIVDKAVEQAAEGDPAARSWLSGYLVGTPKGARCLPSGLDMADKDDKDVATLFGA